MTKKRRRYSGEEKAAILREHLVDRVPVSDVCEKYGIHPTQFYRWQKALFDSASEVLSGSASKRSKQRDTERSRVEYFEGKLRKKDEVIAELMEEHVAPKKSLGEI